jgi:crotonobetainyl-CoA:carnitine CoA-transferase CaiB-like acyl-CoA transferase
MFGKGILDGVRVLAIEQQVAAPYCTMMLSDQGAEVIKIERAGVGDRPVNGTILRNGDKTSSGYFTRFNRNKKSVTLDFSKPEAIEILKDLIAKSDIIVENFKPGMMDKFGLTGMLFMKLIRRLFILPSAALAAARKSRDLLPRDGL